MNIHDYTRRDFLKASGLAAASLAIPGCDCWVCKSAKGKRKEKSTISPNYTIACYYFPNYHPNDARNIKQKGKGWSEWELVKNAKPRFEGH